MNAFSLSWKNIINKPLSMVLSLTLFALGVGLIALLLSLNQQIQEKFEKNLAGIDLVIGAKGSPLQMILCNMYHIDAPTGNIPIKTSKAFLNPKHPLIKLSVPLSLGDSYKGHRIVGTTHTYVDSIFYGKIADGRLWNTSLEVTIGAEVARKLGLKIGDQFHSSHGFIDDGINTHDHGDGFKVVGILAANGSVLDQLILTSTQSIWEVHDHEAEANKPSPPQSKANEEEHDHDHHDHDHSDNDHAGHDHGDHHDHDHPAPVAVPQTTEALMGSVDKDITSILVRYRNRSDWRSLNMPRNINENTEMQTQLLK